MLTFYYSQFSPPLFPVDAVAALPDSFIYLFISTPHKVVGRERALFIGLLPQKSTDAVVGDYNKHTNTLFWHTNRQQARSRSLLA